MESCATTAPTPSARWSKRFSTRSEENTYQYKPYGGVLAKTGTAADPSFLWNGGSEVSGHKAHELGILRAGARCVIDDGAVVYS